MSEFLEIPVLVQPLTPLSVGGVSIPIGSFQTTITIRAEDLTLNLSAHAQIGVGVPELQQVRPPQFAPARLPQSASPVNQQPTASPQPAAVAPTLGDSTARPAIQTHAPAPGPTTAAASATPPPSEPAIATAAPEGITPTATASADDDDFLPPPIPHEVGSQKNPLQVSGREESNADFLQRFQESA